MLWLFILRAHMTHTQPHSKIQIEVNCENYSCLRPCLCITHDTLTKINQLRCWDAPMPNIVCSSSATEAKKFVNFLVNQSGHIIKKEKELWAYNVTLGLALSVVFLFLFWRNLKLTIYSKCGKANGLCWLEFHWPQTSFQGRYLSNYHSVCLWFLFPFDNSVSDVPQLPRVIGNNSMCI